MKLTDTAIRYLIVCMLVLLILGLVYSSYAGKKQDNQFMEGQAIYNEAIKHLENENYEEALLLFENLDLKYSESVPLNYYMGLAFANLSEWDKATKEFIQLLDLNPYKTEDPVVMLQYAKVLVYGGKKVEAKTVLEHCQTLPIPEQIPNYNEEVSALLLQITN